MEYSDRVVFLKAGYSVVGDAANRIGIHRLRMSDLFHEAMAFSALAEKRFAQLPKQVRDSSCWVVSDLLGDDRGVGFEFCFEPNIWDSEFPTYTVAEFISEIVNDYIEAQELIEGVDPNDVVGLHGNGSSQVACTKLSKKTKDTLKIVQNHLLGQKEAGVSKLIWGKNSAQVSCHTGPRSNHEVESAYVAGRISMLDKDKFHGRLRCTSNRKLSSVDLELGADFDFDEIKHLLDAGVVKLTGKARRRYEFGGVSLDGFIIESVELLPHGAGEMNQTELDL